MAVCGNCGQEIGDGLSTTNQWGTYHLDERRCLDAAIHRAERAEGELAILGHAHAGLSKAASAQLAAAGREIADLRTRLEAARFITDRLPPAGQYVEALVAAAWEPGVESAGRWRSPAYETLHVRGWRPTAPDDKEGQA